MTIPQSRPLKFRFYPFNSSIEQTGDVTQLPVDPSGDDGESLVQRFIQLLKLCISMPCVMSTALASEESR
jgi:hypothetical protein